MRTKPKEHEQKVLDAANEMIEGHKEVFKENKNET
jgi:hypothetical protein